MILRFYLLTVLHKVIIKSKKKFIFFVNANVIAVISVNFRLYVYVLYLYLPNRICIIENKL